MFDPSIGRWLNEDPMGFDAGDPNLYRYVGNRPIIETDPSGLQEIAWNSERVRRALDISGRHGEVHVRSAIELLDTTYALNRIPVVIPNHAPPEFIQISEDRGYSWPNHLIGGMSYAPVSTEAQRARLSTRVNLIAVKQTMVDRIYNMVVDHPQGGHQWNAEDRNSISAMANRTSDDLIRMVDLFLRTHAGARPSQGTRLRFGITFGDRFSRPWCADWAEAMATWTSHAITSNPPHPANRYIEIRWGQSNNRGQHNFLVINPIGYRVQLSRPGDAAVDPVIAIFDPWRELLPRFYEPIPLTEGNGAPTNFFSVNQVEDTFYRDRLRDPLFREPNLNLGPR